MISDINSKLVRIILAVAKEEKSAEVTRQVIAQQPKFEPYAAFQRIAQDGFITKEGLKKFLE